jgi:hypothetical protein
VGFLATRRSPEDLLTPPRMWPEDFLGRDRSLRRSMSADVALSEKSPYLGGAWVRWGLSNNPESMESCRFEISGFQTGRFHRFSNRH